MINKILNFLIKPFTNKPFLFVFFTLLITFIEIYNSISLNEIYSLIKITLFGSLLAYIIIFVYNIISNNIIKNTYLILSLTTIILMHIINYLTNSILHLNFSAEIASIITETNYLEIKEFFSNFINSTHILFIILIITISVLSIILINKFDKIHIPRKIALISLIIPILGIGVYISHPHIRYYTFIGTMSACRYVFKKTPELKLSLNKSDITIFGSQPQNIILIIGESYVKSHSSIYGYNYNTTPFMKKLSDNNELIIYNNVITPATHTNDAFTHIMTKSSNDNLNWYESISIPELANNADYETYWISNQNQKGLYDNISSRFASLCSHQFFSDNTYKLWDKKNYDEVVLPQISKVASNDTTSKKFIIIHLMGQHFEFKTRHPKSFDHFKPNQYTHLPSNQREIIANYDNATLYNDSIVSEIISTFKDQESIIIYTSDHGLDLFSSSPEYYGYAKADNNESYRASTEIPFIIYTSKKYNTNHTDKYNELRGRTSQHFNTDNLILFIMDIMNVKLK